MKAFKRQEVDKTNSREYLEELISQYQNLIFSICYKMTGDYFAAQDLAQETFLSAYQHLDSFDGKDEKSWLCRIASNKSIDYLRQAGRRVIPTEESEFPEQHSNEGQPEREVLEENVRKELLINCRRLKEPYNQIAYLYFYRECKPAEIADRLHKNLKTIQTQIYRARDMMRKLYQEIV